MQGRPEGSYSRKEGTAGLEPLRSPGPQQSLDRKCGWVCLKECPGVPPKGRGGRAAETETSRNKLRHRQRERDTKQEAADSHRTAETD